MSAEPVIEFGAGFVSGEADYFSAILALQNATAQSAAIPSALLDVVGSFSDTIEKEGILLPASKPVLISAVDLTGYGNRPNSAVFLLAVDGMQTVLAFDAPAIIATASLLLGGKPAATKRQPSNLEMQIIQRLIHGMDANFVPVEAPQTSILWQDFVGASVALGATADDPCMVVMINRRVENVATPTHVEPDSQQQNFIRQAVGNSMLSVDYVLDGGEVLLSTIRHLEAGSVLPLTYLSQTRVDARANGKTVFDGVLVLTPEHMGVDITRVFAEARND